MAKNKNIMDLEMAQKLALETDYAIEAVGEEINTADAAAFFLEGYEYAIKSAKINIKERKSLFKTKVAVYLGHYKSNLLKEFFEYWTEHGEKDRKMRFEKEKSFDISRRLNTWDKRSKSYNKQPITSTGNVNDKWKK